MFLLLAIIAVVGCTNKQQEAPVEQTTLSGLKKSDFQSVVNGDSTDLYVLTNDNGVEVTLTNYGGRIVSVMVPDKGGKMQDVVLGFDNVDDYVAKSIWLHIKKVGYDESKKQLTERFGSPTDEGENPYVEIDGGAVRWAIYQHKEIEIRLSSASERDFVEISVVSSFFRTFDLTW